MSLLRNPIMLGLAVSLMASAALAQTPTPVQSKWDKVNLGLVGLSAAHTPDGNVVFWSGDETKKPYAGTGTRNTLFTIFNGTAASGVSRQEVGTQFYGQGQALDADGKLSVVGGHPRSNMFGYFDGDTFVLAPSNERLNRGRFLSSLVTLSTGDLFVLGGNRGYDPIEKKGATQSFGEIHSPGQAWSERVRLTWFIKDAPLATAEMTKDRTNNPWLFAMAGPEHVFYAGPSKDMKRLFLNNNGRIYSTVARGTSDAAHGSAVMYRPGEILVTGGVPKYSDGNQNASAAAYTIKFDIGVHSTRNRDVTVTKLDAGKSPTARAFHNSVVLPDGNVLIVGGSSKGKLYDDRNAVHKTEIWNPADGSIKTLRDLPTKRTYESTALLLPDARVIVAGGGYCGTCEGYTATPHTDADILTPPYLLTSTGAVAARPEFSMAPTEARAGSHITVRMGTNQDSAPVAAKFSLVRMSSTSHGVNTDQRWLEIKEFGRLNPRSMARDFDLTLPTRAEGLIPGNHMLFALDDKGVPSVARIINIK